MLKVRAIKIEVNTNEGLFGAKYNFSSGLNIIRGDNSSGKSTLFQSILYALGFEELLGGRNAKTMQSVLKDQVEYNDELHKVIESSVSLEIENEEIITIKRFVISPTKKEQLVEVYYGSVLVDENHSCRMQQMYVHSKGSASDNLYGFHAFLAEFLKWELPEVLTTQGETIKLYLQQIAPSFIVEQKSGWTDFLATIPYYSTKNAESRVIEFILNLDVFATQKKKQEYQYDKRIFDDKWTKLYSKFENIAKNTRTALMGISSSPEIINNKDVINLIIQREDGDIDLTEELINLKRDYSKIENIQYLTVGENASINEARLTEQQNKLGILTIQYDMLNPELTFDNEKLQQYTEQLVNIDEDLRKNKGALKIQNLGGNTDSVVAALKCPTCNQKMENSLLPVDVEQIPMRLEDNISYLESQKRMIEAYIESLKNIINNKQQRLINYQEEIKEIRQSIRDLKNELIQDNRLPSLVELERKINMKKKIDFYEKSTTDFLELKDEAKRMSDEYQSLLRRKNQLPKTSLTAEDYQKLVQLEKYFKEILKSLNYRSKPLKTVKISEENYLPITKTEDGGFYSIKFDSSASDFIRCLWAYHTALMQASLGVNGNHPLFFMLDEPKQQDIAMVNFKLFLEVLSKFKEQQVLVLASFENSDTSFKDATAGIDFNLVRIENKLICPIDNNDEN